MVLFKTKRIKQVATRISGILVMTGLVFAGVAHSDALSRNDSVATTTTSKFSSTADPNVLPMLNGFKTLSPSTRAENNTILLAVNNSATPTERAEASKADGYPKPGNANARYSLSNTKYLGGVQTAYLAADAAGEVSLVDALLAEANDAKSTHLDLNTEWPSADNAKATYANLRPYCTNLNANIIRGSGSGIYNNAACAKDNYSFPSGHSRLIWVEGVALSIMLPEVAPQIMARSAELANYRIVLGVHYPLDIIAGRALATRMVAARLHDDVWRAKFDAAKTQLREAITRHCGTATIQACIDAHPTTMSTADALAFERSKLTYGFTQSGAAGVPLTTTPSYAYELLYEAFPGKTPAELSQILKDTAIDSGYPLDTTGTSAGVENIGWTRFDLAKALTGASAPTATNASTNTSPVQQICAGSEFADVSTTTPSCTTINWMKEQKLSTGYNENGVVNFHPERSVTREATAAFLYRYTHPGQPIPACSGSVFADVTASNPFCGAITWMMQEGISTGSTTTTFRPSGTVTREDIAVLLYRSAHANKTLPACTNSSFTDVALSSPSCSAINWMKEQGIVTGDDKTFRPTETVTRETMSILLYRYAHR